MMRLHEKIFHAFTDFYRMEDAKITYVIKCLQNVPQKELGVEEEYCFPQKNAIETFKKLCLCKTPIDMLLLLKQVKNYISDEINIHQRDLNKSGNFLFFF